MLSLIEMKLKDFATDGKSISKLEEQFDQGKDKALESRTTTINVARGSDTM